MIPVNQWNQHLVQFYENDCFLNDEVIDYIHTGMEVGDTCIVIAVKSRLRDLEQSLAQREQDSPGAAGGGQYLWLDAEAVLPQIMIEGWPDANRFAVTVGSIIAEAARYGKVRIFGEMVALLWAEHRYEAALHLKKLWNTLALRHPFSLLCSYPLNHLADATLGAYFQQVCRAHQQVLPAESHTMNADAEHLQRAIASLQQKAGKLEQERHRQRDHRQAERLLRAANDELELRVRERTARLQKSNALLTEEITERKRAEQALQQSQQLLRELGQHTETIIEEERKRIARELHDQLGQNLMALRIDVLMMSGAAGSAHAQVAPMAESALNNIDSMIKNVRAIINNLRPAVLELGLAATFEWEIKEFERRSGIRCTLTTDRSEFRIDDGRALALLRILQESLTNVLRHAHADRVDIRLHGDERTLCLQVADNGVGDDPDGRRKTNAFGLVGIRERVSALGGAVSIVTEKGKGLALTVHLPLPD